MGILLYLSILELTFPNSELTNLFQFVVKFTFDGKRISVPIFLVVYICLFEFLHVFNLLVLNIQLSKWILLISFVLLIF